MKLFCALTVLATTAFASVNPQLHQVKRVYILAMGSGMDQYLANQLTKAGIFAVVTDPKEADAIVSDSIGETFQKKLDDLYPPAPKTPAPSKGALDASKPGADASAAVGGNAPAATPSRRDAFADIDFSGGGFRSGSFGRGKGNFFVVDRNSRIVLWSVYERPKNSTPGELTKSAGRVVKHLKDDLTEKKASE